MTAERGEQCAGRDGESQRGCAEVDDDDALDRALDALGDTYRRRLLARLHDAAPSVGVPVTDVETGTVPPDVHHVHLPKLEGYDYVETTYDSRLVYRSENFEEVAAVMRVLEANASAFPGDWP